MKRQNPGDSVFSFSHIGKKRKALGLDKASGLKGLRFPGSWLDPG